ncbi:MAG: sulfatase-like hydrolase/transferase, partial [Candidatus Latescibacteria bacterium]|nr:sulfatase-like hydrolase/transferase [Candidatus Latescibacterota bacterium]
MVKPNVVLILADDMGYGDFGVFNDGKVKTPTLDRLVDESVCLTQHYSGSPVCSPARACLLTGRYPHRTGALTPQEMMGLDRIALREVTLADAFRQGGYHTGCFGKWHNGALDARFHPNARGFDEFVGFCGGWMDYYNWWLDINGQRQQGDGRYLTEVLTDAAVDFIHRRRDTPFFLYVPYNAPHSPLQAPDKTVQFYEDMGLSKSVATIYAMIEEMDNGIARILDTLEKEGLADNTIVMVSSDNGPALRHRPDQVSAGMSVESLRHNCGFKGAKGSVYEGGIRVPMILRWPDGLPRGQEITELIHFTDWLPTLLAMVGLERGDGPALDGHNVLPILRGESPDEAPRQFWQWSPYTPPIITSNAAMRDGAWKLVQPQLNIQFATEEGQALAQRYLEMDIQYKYEPDRVVLMQDPIPERIIPEAKAPELYDIATDPLEEHNVADQYPERG